MMWQDKIRQILEAKELSQRQVALRSGITEGTLSRYLTGSRMPRVDIITNIAKTLEVETEFLLSEEEEPPKRPYTTIATAIIQNGKELTPTEANRLIALILKTAKNCR